MTVRAKFQCTEQTRRCWDATKEEYFYAYSFDAVLGGSEENKAFFKATPSGHLEMSAVVPLFVPGKTYYLDFTLVE